MQPAPPIRLEDGTTRGWAYLELALCTGALEIIAGR
jgi:hypothetical protein